MIDWLNEFSFEAVARLVHPLVVLAVLIVVNVAVGYSILGSLRARDKEAKMSGEVAEGETSSDYFAFFLLSILFMFVGAVQALLCTGWWMSWGVSREDALVALVALSFVSSVVLGGTPILGTYLPRRRKGD